MVAKLMGNNQFNPNDLHQMAREALRKAPDELIFDDPTDSEAIVKASKEGYKGKDAGEAKEWLRAVEKGLDMSYEARMERAKAMGFDIEKKWYHGTDKEFAAFDLDATAINRTDNPAGIYLTPYEDEAAEYGEKVLSLLVRAEYPFTEGESEVTDAMVDKYTELLKKHSSYSDDWIDRVIAPKFKETGYPKGLSGNNVTEVLKAGGYDSYKDGRHLAVFYPNDIRSIDAAFDIAEFESANLLASKTTVSDIFKPIAEQAAKFVTALNKMMDKANLISRPQPIEVGKPSTVLKSVGVPNLPIMIDKDAVKKATNGIKHDVSMKTIEALPEILANPVMILDSSTEANSIVILSEYKDASNRPVLIALHMNKQGKHFNINDITSIYGKDDAKFFSKEWKKGNGRYINKENLRAWAQSVGVQFSEEAFPSSRGNYITEKDLINSEAVKFSKRQPASDFEVADETPLEKTQRLFQDDKNRWTKIQNAIKASGGKIDDSNDAYCPTKKLYPFETLQFKHTAASIKCCKIIAIC